MKIQSLAEAPAAEQQLLVLEFEFLESNDVHEAGVVINALAANNARTFESARGELAAKHIDTRRTARGQEWLVAATREYVEKGVDQFLAVVRRQASDKAREGRLTEPIRMKSTAGQLDFLHACLTRYRDNTGNAVDMEPRNTMGDNAGLLRTNEGLTAGWMAHSIEVEAGITPAPPQPETPIGFGRVLLELDDEGVIAHNKRLP